MAGPLPEQRLKQITTDVCDQALQSTTSYSHASVNSWNTQIISRILESLISETSSKDSPPKYKFAVNSTIIQHYATISEEDGSGGPVGGRRGMHSAQGAYWDNDKDGQWSMKYAAGEEKGMDVVVSIMWIAI